MFEPFTVAWARSRFPSRMVWVVRTSIHQRISYRIGIDTYPIGSPCRWMGSSHRGRGGVDQQSRWSVTCLLGSDPRRRACPPSPFRPIFTTDPGCPFTRVALRGSSKRTRHICTKLVAAGSHVQRVKKHILPPPERHDTDEETGRGTGKRPEKRKVNSPNTFSGDGRANPTHEET